MPANVTHSIHSRPRELNSWICSVCIDRHARVRGFIAFLFEDRFTISIQNNNGKSIQTTNILTIVFCTVPDNDAIYREFLSQINLPKRIILGRGMSLCIT